MHNANLIYDHYSISERTESMLFSVKSIISKRWLRLHYYFPNCSHCLKKMWLNSTKKVFVFRQNNVLLICFLINICMSPHRVKTESLSHSLSMHFPLLPGVWIYALQSRFQHPRRTPSEVALCPTVGELLKKGIVQNWRLFSTIADVRNDFTTKKSHKLPDKTNNKYIKI